jgi:hypothetical protein
VKNTRRIRPRMYTNAEVGSPKSGDIPRLIRHALRRANAISVRPIHLQDKVTQKTRTLFLTSKLDDYSIWQMHK